MKNWEKEFNEIYRRATGEENIVGDLLVKQFIQNLLDKQKEDIKDIIASLFMDTHLVDREDKVINKFYRDISEEIDKLK